MSIFGALIGKRAQAPAGMIETAAGRMLADDGHGRLLAALDEAHEMNDHVGISLLGPTPRTWAFFTGDHVATDQSVDLGKDLVILADSTIGGTDGGIIAWRGGHTMPNGDRLERFTLDGVAMTLTWSDANGRRQAA